MAFEILQKDKKSRARLGLIKTIHGSAPTPGFVAVGTHGNIKLLNSEDIPASGTKMVISNTYHLWRDLKEEGLEKFPGLNNFMNWPGVSMTDSGGFQVFSLGWLKERGFRMGSSSDGRDSWAKVDDLGVGFKTPDGWEGYLDSEKSVFIQEKIGADIIAAFDQPTGPSANRQDTEIALERTNNWARRCVEARSRNDQMMYGVVQGGDFEDLRKKSADFLNQLPLEGFAIGSTYGDGYGGSREATARMLDWSIPYLSADKPRHLFGVGRVADIFAGVVAGIDTFDCVIPTREGRHGRIWTRRGYYDLKKGVYLQDDNILEEGCGCPVCSTERRSRKEIRQYFKEGLAQGPRLASIHNLWFVNNLMSEIREGLKNEALEEVREKYKKAL